MDAAAAAGPAGPAADTAGPAGPVKYTISGVDVHFPFKPYGSQVAMMNKVRATCIPPAGGWQGPHGKPAC